MTTEQTTKREAQREQMLTVLRQMVADKREDEKKAIEEYKNDPNKRAFVAELSRRNAECGTPPTHYAFERYRPE